MVHMKPANHYDACRIARSCVNNNVTFHYIAEEWLFKIFASKAVVQHIFRRQANLYTLIQEAD